MEKLFRRKGKRSRGKNRLAATLKLVKFKYELHVRNSGSKNKCVKDKKKTKH